MAPASELFLGIDWADGSPRVRIGALAPGAGSWSMPLDEPLRYRVDGERRFCCGWFDLRGTTSRHVSCAEAQLVTTGVQCAACRQREGFLTAHRAHGGSPVAANVRRHLAQPHWVYVAAFGGGHLKVGTVAASRLDSRLPEQGALAARYVAKAADGVVVRRVEDAVADRLGVATAVSRRRKLAALLGPLDAGELEAEVDDLAIQAQEPLGGLDVECLDPATTGAWRPPTAVEAVLARPRRASYARSPASGAHALAVVGVVGSIVACAAGSDDGACLLADLADLRGHPIQRGDDVVAPDEPVQFSLF